MPIPLYLQPGSEEDAETITNILKEHDYSAYWETSGDRIMISYAYKHHADQPTWMPRLEHTSEQFCIRGGKDMTVVFLAIDQIDGYVDELQRLQSVLEEIVQRVGTKYVVGAKIGEAS